MGPLSSQNGDPRALYKGGKHFDSLQTVPLGSIQDFRDTPIVLKKEDKELGIEIVGGSDSHLIQRKKIQKKKAVQNAVCVSSVREGGSAYRDGRLQRGDILLAVNGTDLRRKSHDEAIQALQEASSPVKLIVLRENPHLMFTTDEEPTRFVTVQLRKHVVTERLGLSLMSGREGKGIFVTWVEPGSPASRNGRILQGDLLMEINGQDIRRLPYDDVIRKYSWYHHPDTHTRKRIVHESDTDDTPSQWSGRVAERSRSGNETDAKCDERFTQMSANFRFRRMNETEAERSERQARDVAACIVPRTGETEEDRERLDVNARRVVARSNCTVSVLMCLKQLKWSSFAWAPKRPSAKLTNTIHGRLRDAAVVSRVPNIRVAKWSCHSEQHWRSGEVQVESEGEVVLLLGRVPSQAMTIQQWARSPSTFGDLSNSSTRDRSYTWAGNPLHSTQPNNIE
ncbi:unnamed protein product [Darwinula stevensoni]|uniref:PDZ domain-containing protein n=1 Tax=Darwinula stevensoni TaxID=69355 RepID=A0A7R9AD27_9CRUS|nr:unnamed protein product [Darwinula stevensoni]CAG0900723.1 unnamed protein product [Darwinula stevensoni]